MPASAECSRWDVSGSWQIDTPRGNFSIIITQDGSSLGGQGTTTPSIIEGSISGNQTRFSARSPTANVGRVYEGTIDASGQWSGWFHSIGAPDQRWAWLGMRQAHCLAQGGAPAGTVEGGPIASQAPVPDATGVGTSAVGTRTVDARMIGSFETTFGLMNLAPDGGNYDFKDGRLAVEQISEAVIEGVWMQSESDRQCADGSYYGRFRFEFTQWGFFGFYGFCDEPPTRSGWNGTRL